MKKFILLSVFILSSVYLHSQESSEHLINRYGSEAFTSIHINPAFTGILGKHVFNGSYKLIAPQKWTINQYYVDYSTTIGKKRNLGIGAYYYVDKIEFTSDKELNVSVSYKLIHKQDFDITLGGSVLTFHRLKLDLDGMRNGAVDPDDPLLLGKKYVEDRLNYNLGLWLNYSKFYVGFSSLDLITINLKNANVNPNVTFRLITGYDFSINSKFGLSPSFYLENIFADKSRYNFAFSANYSNVVFAGMTYSFHKKVNDDFFGLQGGVLIYKKVRIIFGYEFWTDKEMRKAFNYEQWKFGLRFQY